jgi:hypothetical protein
MTFAVRVAQADDATIQNVLMDAFDGGMVNCNTVTRVRKLLEMRMNRGKGKPRSPRGSTPSCTVKELARAIATPTKAKEAFVRETTRKETGCWHCSWARLRYWPTISWWRCLLQTTSERHPC